MTSQDTLIQALRDRVAELEEELRQARGVVVERGYHAPPEWALTAKEEALAVAFAKHGFLSKQGVMTALWSPKWDLDGVPDAKLADVFICKLRKKLARFGVSIETVWGRGYEMPAASRSQMIKAGPP